MDNYILNPDHSVSLCNDLTEWGKWMNSVKNRRVGLDVLTNGVRISTVFLGLDHSFGGGPPVLFETMVFPPNSSSELHCERYETWERAYRRHQWWVVRMKLEARRGDGTSIPAG